MTHSKPGFRRRTGLTLAVIATLIVVVGCAGAASEAQRDSDTSGGRTTPDLGFGSAPEAAAPGTDTKGGSDGTQLYDAARPDLLVIKTGSLELQVAGVEDATTAAAKAIGALGGYVSGSEQYGDAENLTASITYRIPSEHWDEAVAALRGLAIKVLTAQTQTQDVTGQVVDLGARIDNLRVTEQALQSIMTKATKVADVLAVQAELTTVRGEIERATAEKQHLQEQASLSTLTVRFSLQPDPIGTSKQKFNPGDQVDRAVASLVEVLQGLATAGIWVAIVWFPILLALALIVGLVVMVLRRRNLFVRPAAVPADASATVVVDAAPADDSDAGTDGPTDRPA
ncbi:MAG: DUF4349 domain-containing protein [Candidatus Limnocylindrales bacterium]